MNPLPSILLVDDNATTNYLHKLLLTRLQVAEQVLVALNGQQALDLLQLQCATLPPQCPALILLDLKMPVMNGFEFLEAYQYLPLPQRQGIVIIMLTTSLHERDLERLQNLPIAGLLSKPLTELNLRELLHQHFHWPQPVQPA